jgi:hypothetical protein
MFDGTFKHNNVLISGTFIVNNVTNQQGHVTQRVLYNDFDGVSGALGREDSSSLCGALTVSPSLSDEVQASMDAPPSSRSSSVASVGYRVPPPSPASSVESVASIGTMPSYIVVSDSPVLKPEEFPESPMFHAEDSPPFSPPPLERSLSDASTEVLPASPRSPSPPRRSVSFSDQLEFIPNPSVSQAGFVPHRSISYLTRSRVNATSNNFTLVERDVIDAYVSKYGDYPVRMLVRHWNGPNYWKYESIIADELKNGYYLRNNTNRNTLYRQLNLVPRPPLPHCTKCLEVFDTNHEGGFEARYCSCIDYERICKHCVAEEESVPVKCDDCKEICTKKRARSHEFFGFAEERNVRRRLL